ncbi:MAG: hypothetical protein EAY65_00040 [Alphaproteobacteria bacterium]|nr:MAG: hypothetical protein EAY65_00040 [Alphaproteobacteria bacterium]
MKYVILLVSIMIGISGCGFTPVYDQRQTYSNELASVRIQTPKGRDHQQIRVALEDRLAPMGGGAQSDYILEPNVQISLQPISIETDGTTSRYRVIGTSMMRFYRASDRKELLVDRIQRFSSYTIGRADFSTYISNQDATRQLMDELAEEIRLRLIRYFAMRDVPKEE